MPRGSRDHGPGRQDFELRPRGSEGDSENPLTDEELQNKFRLITPGIIDEGQVREDPGAGGEFRGSQSQRTVLHLT